jgi:membrane associated rhomboid family serine protease
MGIIATNLAVFMYELWLPSASQQSLISNYGLIAAAVAAHWQVFFLTASTSMFLHLGWAHLLGNMWFFWIFGRAVEDRMSVLNFLLLYCLSGYCAAGVQLLINPFENIPMVGASGAISGVLGAYCYAFPNARITTLIPFLGWIKLMHLPAAFYLTLWFVLQIGTGFATIVSGQQQPVQIAFFAHAGGFLCGYIFGYLTVVREPS